MKLRRTKNYAKFLGHRDVTGRRTDGRWHIRAISYMLSRVKTVKTVRQYAVWGRHFPHYWWSAAPRQNRRRALISVTGRQRDILLACHDVAVSQTRRLYWLRANHRQHIMPHSLLLHDTCSLNPLHAIHIICSVGVVVRALDLWSRASQVRLPAGALLGSLGQLSLPSLRCR